MVEGAEGTTQPWSDGYGSPSMPDPGEGHKYNFTQKTGIKSVRDACAKLNDGYDITEWPFTLAYVYSESQKEWYAVFRDDFDRKDVPDSEWIEPSEPWP